jgi:hypothetical protein
MREKHERSGQPAFVTVEVMSSDPGGVDAAPLRMNDLLGSQLIPLSGCRLIEEPGEEAEPPWRHPRHADVAPSAVLERAKRGRDLGPLLRRTEGLVLRSRQSKIFPQ